MTGAFFAVFFMCMVFAEKDCERDPSFPTLYRHPKIGAFALTFLAGLAGIGGEYVARMVWAAIQ